MAIVTPTSSNVERNQSTTTQTVQAGEALTPGDVVYQKSSDFKYYKSDNTTEEKADIKGIAVTYASTDGYVSIATNGTVDLGAVLTDTVHYYSSSTGGSFEEEGDLLSTEWKTRLGYATSSSILQLDIQAIGQVP